MIFYRNSFEYSVISAAEVFILVFCQMFILRNFHIVGFDITGNSANYISDIVRIQLFGCFTDIGKLRMICDLLAV